MVHCNIFVLVADNFKHLFSTVHMIFQSSVVEATLGLLRVTNCKNLFFYNSLLFSWWLVGLFYIHFLSARIKMQSPSLIKAATCAIILWNYQSTAMYSKENMCHIRNYSEMLWYVWWTNIAGQKIYKHPTWTPGIKGKVGLKTPCHHPFINLQEGFHPGQGLCVSRAYPKNTLYEAGIYPEWAIRHQIGIFVHKLHI